MKVKCVKAFSWEIVLLSTGIPTMLMIRSLRADIAHFNSRAISNDLLAETGWILVCDDVFWLEPGKLKSLVSIVCPGIQLLLTTLVTICERIGDVSVYLI